MTDGGLLPSVGDVVTLISGGPAMTVEKLESPHASAASDSPPLLVRCVWFNDAGAFATHAFNPAVLAESGPATPTAPPAPSDGS